MTEPVVEKPQIPPEYGNPSQRLEWADVERKLASATVYWIASTRPDGRPHVIPRDGMWLDGGLYYGGSPETVHHRNITHNPHVVVHIGDGQEAIIVEGVVEIEEPTEEMAKAPLRCVVRQVPAVRAPRPEHVHGRRVGPPAAPGSLTEATMVPLMELFTVGYEGRTLPQLVQLLEEHGITRLVDVRHRPASRKRGFSALALFEALRKSGITYESDRLLGNPDEIRELWKNGSLGEGKRRYRKLIRNGRRARVEVLVALSAAGRLCILCYEEDPDLCHRTLIAEEAVRLEPALLIRAL